MVAEIITIGDEILIGQIVDTNSAWMAEELHKIGIRIHQITSISDDKEHIWKALNAATDRADIILITGGLGPTKDDLTKSSLTEYFNDKLVFNEELYRDVKEVFDSRGIPMPDVNYHQAEVPSSCLPIRNTVGTAPGMWFDKGEKVFVSMPGVPYEMKEMMSTEVIPRLAQRFETPELIHKTVLTHGIGESTLMEVIGTWEESLQAEEIKLAYLPSAGRVRLRLSSWGSERILIEEKINAKIEELKLLIPEFYTGAGEQQIEVFLGQWLTEKRATLSTAESCTGGYIAHRITSVPGSSAYFIGSVIAYSNQVKEEILGVKKQSLEDYGAVSKEVVEEMALGVRKHFKTDYAIATSGIAGPGGGSEEKPVGTVWIAVASPTGVVSRKFLFSKNRQRNIESSTSFGLMMLQKEINNSGDN